jgi:hypothetical protein
VVAASLIQTPPPGAAAMIVGAFTQSAWLELPELVAESTVTVPAVTFGWPAFEPPALPSSTEPWPELNVAVFEPALIEPTKRLPALPITTGPLPAVTELTVAGEVEASLIQTPPLVAVPEMFAEFTQRASLALPALTAELTVTAAAVTFGLPAFEPPAMPSVTAPVAEFNVALPEPALIVPMLRSPWPPMTTGPLLVTEATVTGVVAASLIHTPPLVADPEIVGAFTQSASLALPAATAELTDTEPAVTFG